MSKYSKNILVTGGGGVIGSNFLVYMVNKYDNIRFINIDKLTYCSNLQYLKNIDNKSNYKFNIPYSFLNFKAYKVYFIILNSSTVENF